MSAVQTQANASESNAVRAWITRRPAVSFYVLTLAVTAVIGGRAVLSK